MSAPYRLERRDVGEREVARDQGEALKDYLERLMKVIPSEVIGLYIIGGGLIPEGETLWLIGWFAFGLVAVLAIRTFGTADLAEGKPPQPVPVAIAVVAFAIWAYTLGGPFAALGLTVPWVGSLLVLMWSFVIPFFYKGPPAT